MLLNVFKLHLAQKTVETQHLRGNSATMTCMSTLTVGYVMQNYAWLDTLDQLPHFREVRGTILAGIKKSLRYETQAAALNAYVAYIYKHSGDDIYSLGVVRTFQLVFSCIVRNLAPCC